VTNAALVRLEQLCPFPVKELQDAISYYTSAKGKVIIIIYNSFYRNFYFLEFIWSQEEHRNMGAWTFVRPRFENMVGVAPHYRGRGELCQPAVGVGEVHRKEAVEVVEAAFQ